MGGDDVDDVFNMRDIRVGVMMGQCQVCHLASGMASSRPPFHPYSVQSIQSGVRILL